MTAFILHPDLTLTCDGRHWVLHVDAPDLTGTMSSTSQETVFGLARGYAKWRESTANIPKRQSED